MKNGLLQVPDKLADQEGEPRFGAYRGVIPDGALTGLSPDYDRRGLKRIRTEKSWIYVGLSSDDWLAGLAIIRLGYGAASFTFLFDRNERKFLLDEFRLAPPALAARIDPLPGDGCQSWFRIPGYRTSVLHPSGLGRYQLRIRLTGGSTTYDLAAELSREEAPEGMTAICPVGGLGSVNLTVKQVALPARGRWMLGDRSVEFDSGTHALIDYSHGFLDSTTSWMWACAGGRGARGRVLGLNLVAGFNDSLENTIWVGKQILPVGEVSFHRGTEGPEAPWTIQSDDGRVDLTFTPEGTRSEQKDLGPFSSHYFQPVGTFSGRLKDAQGKSVKVDGLSGVCEEHFSRW